MPGIYHTSNDQLELYAMGRLSGSDSDELEDHLLICEHCQLRLDEMETYVLALKRALVAQSSAPAAESMWEKFRQALAGLRFPPAPVFAGGVALVAMIFGIQTLLPRRLAAPISSDPVTIHLEAMKGAGENIAANRPLQLVLDGRGLPPEATNRVRIVDRRGAPVWEGSAVLEQDQLRANVPKPLGPGDYFVRVFGAGSDPVREYGLRIQ